MEMNDTIMVNGLIEELSIQRNLLGDRAAKLAAELSVAKARNAALEEELKELKPEPESPR